jgi:hypothetical protein
VLFFELKKNIIIYFVFESDGKPMVQLVVVANIVYPYLFSFSAFIFLNHNRGLSRCFGNGTFGIILNAF